MEWFKFCPPPKKNKIKIREKEKKLQQICDGLVECERNDEAVLITVLVGTYAYNLLVDLISVASITCLIPGFVTRRVALVERYCSPFRSTGVHTRLLLWFALLNLCFSEWVSDCRLTWPQQFSAISWREQVIF